MDNPLTELRDLLNEGNVAPPSGATEWTNTEVVEWLAVALPMIADGLGRVVKAVMALKAECPQLTDEQLLRGAAAVANALHREDIDGD